MTMEIIRKYFSNLTDEQQYQFEQLAPLYEEWNAKINVISRKDIDHLYEHHVLHSLAIAKEISFVSGTTVLDVGTGGGFPGIPLAILFPNCRFKLIDSIGKKVKVAAEIATHIGLKNVDTEHLRGENEKGKYDFVVSRAVMSLPDMAKLIRKNISSKQVNPLPNGLLCLKGGDLTAEIRPFRNIVQVTPIANWFQEEWFKKKNVVYLPF
ncbi:MULTISPECIES: 16S rRNA (guanine(527)-N(7))-methyltransferase RsmG [Prevotellaceae]|uniref:16S rRNA (guanine(527)-N(7))-methyltransferase RsmG n=1 Tax=Prevotellaceae TaxID=171552 RepID=UPI0004175019|nr:16S rRNA (guanine(527)-N(7))-methyltransferase RsmG [Prevotella phocaeensis]